MITLDCETIGSAYDSLAAILQRPRAQLEAWICDLNSDDLGGGYDAVWRALQNDRTIVFHPDWKTTAFFHFTRAMDPIAFRRNGLLPLQSRLLDLLWGHLRDLARDEVTPAEWDAFRQAVEQEQGSMYELKTDPSGTEIGPLGFLVRELAFRPSEFGHHDYLDIPEIIDDISRRGEELLSMDLAVKFRQTATPCIVKFRVRTAEEKYLASALAYAYARSHDGWWFTTTIACDGRGHAIPPTQIVGVECPPDPNHV